MLYKENKDVISTVGLKHLLITLHGHTDTRIRFRLIGRMWEDHFADIIQITDQEMIAIQSGENRQLRFVSVGDIVQFELEDRFQNFECFHHYTVKG